MNNQLIAVLMRFRLERVALVGDIKKMYHSVGISTLDQHCHRLVWRDIESDRLPTTYCVTAVNFGDKPAATISISALRKTADMSGDKFPQAVETLKRNVYVDNVMDSLSNESEARERSQKIDEILEKGSFHIKQWVVSGSCADTVGKIKFLGLKVFELDEFSV